MSMQSWLEEFYPTKASQFIKDKNAIAAIEHSLHKWSGANAKNMAKHEVTFTRGALTSVGSTAFGFATESCSLCMFASDEDGDLRDCSLCPIVIGGDQTCDGIDNMQGAVSEQSPYAIWLNTGDSEPMITLLQQVLDYYKEKEKNALFE